MTGLRGNWGVKSVTGPRGGFDLQGHRGARGLWPENSLIGFAAAMALGVASIELDVVLTADGVPVVHHDLALNPDITRGPGGQWIASPGPLLAALCAGDLAAYDVGRIAPRTRYAAICRGQTPVDGTRIPSLAAVLELVRGSGVKLDIEIKVDRRWPDWAPQLSGVVEAVFAVLDAAQSAGAASVRSFDWRVLRRIRRLRPEVPLSWLTGFGADARAAAVAEAVMLDGWPAWQPVWAPDHRLLRRRHVFAAREMGLLVKPWTVNAAFRMRQLLRWGVDGFCTDRPDLARIVLSE